MQLSWRYKRGVKVFMASGLSRIRDKHPGCDTVQHIDHCSGQAACLQTAEPVLLSMFKRLTASVTSLRTLIRYASLRLSAAFMSRHQVSERASLCRIQARACLGQERGSKNAPSTSDLHKRIMTAATVCSLLFSTHLSLCSLTLSSKLYGSLADPKVIWPPPSYTGLFLQKA